MNTFLTALVCTPHVGWQTIQTLLQHGADASLMDLSVQDWKQRFSFLTPKQTQALAHHVKRDKTEAMLRQWQRQNIRILSIGDERYPPLLKEIDTPPWLLFYKGNLALMEAPGLAVVGSRKTSPYAAHVINRLLPELIDVGWVIYSGLALGVDALAHRTTLQHKGKTVAVLGCGLGHVYPQQNKGLYRLIEQEGLIISEYPPQTPAHPGYFPLRNRIIAGMTYGTLIVQAAQKSGSLITAHHALENGREVFAVPGSIMDRQCAGANDLIQQGARLVSASRHILSEFAHLFPDVCFDARQSTIKTTQVDGHERLLLQSLDGGPKHIDQLLQETSLTFSEAAGPLLQLELKRLIEVLPGAVYQKK